MLFGSFVGASHVAQSNNVVGTLSSLFPPYSVECAGNRLALFAHASINGDLDQAIFPLPEPASAPPDVFERSRLPGGRWFRRPIFFKASFVPGEVIAATSVSALKVPAAANGVTRLDMTPFQTFRVFERAHLSRAQISRALEPKGLFLG